MLARRFDSNYVRFLNIILTQQTLNLLLNNSTFSSHDPSRASLQRRSKHIRYRHRCHRWVFSPEYVISLVETTFCDVANIFLAFFISSRPEGWMKTALRPYVHVAHSLKRDFSCTMFLKRMFDMILNSSLERHYLARPNDRFRNSHCWPLEQEITALLDQSGWLFTYASTAVWYIITDQASYRKRLRAMTRAGSSSSIQTCLNWFPLQLHHHGWSVLLSRRRRRAHKASTPQPPVYACPCLRLASLHYTCQNMTL